MLGGTRIFRVSAMAVFRKVSNSELVTVESCSQPFISGKERVHKVLYSVSLPRPLRKVIATVVG